MIETRSNCVACGFPCMGPQICPNGEYTALICDRCGHEVEALFEWEGEQICEDCLLDEIPHITAESLN